MHRRTLKRSAMLMAAALVLLLGFTALAYVRAQVNSPTTLSAYPDDCDVILTVNFIEARKALADVSWVIKEFSGMEINEQMVLDWLQSALSEPSEFVGETTAIDLESDILPWIGRDMSIGVDYDMEALMAYLETGTEPTPEYPAPGAPFAYPIEEIVNYIMCAVSCRDAGKAKPFLDKLESIQRENGIDPATVTIAEHKWTCVGSDELMGLFGIVEDRLIAFFAPEPKVIPNLERIVGILRSGEGSIMSSSDYRLLTEEVGEGGLLTVITTIDLDVFPAQLVDTGEEAEMSGQPEGTEASEASGLPNKIRTSGIFKIFLDSKGLRIRAANTLIDDQVLAGADTLGFALEPLVLKDISTMVPDYVVGFIQIGSIYEYWSIARTALESLPTPTYEAPSGLEDQSSEGYLDYWSADGGPGAGSFVDESAILPPEVMTFIDTLMSHFVGDTHIALIGDSAMPMVVATSRVRDGDMLVSYLEMLVTQSNPSAQIHFSDHGGVLVKTLLTTQEAGYFPLASYCLVDDLLIVSNLEPAVRLTIDTITGIVPSVEQKPIIMSLREQMGDGGLYLLHVDADSLVEFLRPWALGLTSEEAKLVQTIGRVFDHMSGHVKVRGYLLSGEFEIALRAQPELYTTAVTGAVEETTEEQVHESGQTTTE